MADPALRVRPTGARSTIGRTGFPHIVTPTGGELIIKTGASEAGFNPIDLIYASLSACLAMSARIAAHQLGVVDRLQLVTVNVTGEKAHDDPSRIIRFAAELDIAGDFDVDLRQKIADLAEHICTVSNTLQHTPEIVLTISREKP